MLGLSPKWGVATVFVSLIGTGANQQLPLAHRWFLLSIARIRKTHQPDFKGNFLWDVWGVCKVFLWLLCSAARETEKERVTERERKTKREQEPSAVCDSLSNCPQRAYFWGVVFFYYISLWNTSTIYLNFTCRWTECVITSGTAPPVSSYQNSPCTFDPCSRYSP